MVKYGKIMNKPDEITVSMALFDAHAGAPYIRCLRGEYSGYDIPVLSTGILIGRDASSCHLIFSNTPDVSRYHCRVSYVSKNGYFVVTDLNSLNGVYTEKGRRIASGEKLVLSPRQIFKLCGEQIVFETILQQV